QGSRDPRTPPCARACRPPAGGLPAPFSIWLQRLLIVFCAQPIFISSVNAIQSEVLEATRIEEKHLVRWLPHHLFKELFRHTHMSQIHLDSFRGYDLFWFCSVAGDARELMLVEGEALEPHAVRRRRSPHACCQDKHTRAQALPIIVDSSRSPLLLDFVAK